MSINLTGFRGYDARAGVGWKPTYIRENANKGEVSVPADKGWGFPLWGTGGKQKIKGKVLGLGSTAKIFESDLNSDALRAISRPSNLPFRWIPLP